MAHGELRMNSFLPGREHGGQNGVSMQMIPNESLAWITCSGCRKLSSKRIWNDSVAGSSRSPRTQDGDGTCILCVGSPECLGSVRIPLGSRRDNSYFRLSGISVPRFVSINFGCFQHRDNLVESAHCDDGTSVRLKNCPRMTCSARNEWTSSAAEASRQARRRFPASVGALRYPRFKFVMD